MTAIRFDTLQYSKRAQAVGIKAEHAEFQAEELANLVREDLVTKEVISNLATKDDLAQIKVDLIKWMVGLLFAQSGLFIGVLGFMLHR